MTPTITVRAAVPSDGPVIAKFNALLALETEHRALDQTILRQGVEAVLADSSKGAYFIAEIGGSIVGQLMITYEWSDWRNGLFWWIQSVYVEETSRGKGVFKALFHSIESVARKQSGICGLRLYVERDNHKAKETYQRLSMTKTQYELYEIDFVLPTPGER